MPIIIRRMEKVEGDKFTYAVHVNNKFITTFNHNRKEGLGECLIKAGNAVIEDDRNQIIKNYLKDNIL